MGNNKGFTLVELLITVSIFVMLLTVVSSGFVNTRGLTEKRAYKGVHKFITSNNVAVKRVTCAGDSNSDGYGACAVLTESGEKIMLECPTGFMDVTFFGAESCKEVFAPVFFQNQGE